jgi:hypothetical protein
MRDSIESLSSHFFACGRAAPESKCSNVHHWNKTEFDRMRRRIKPDPDVIVCKLCGKQFRAISTSHLRYRHGWDGDHPGLDYKEQFRLRYTFCDDTRALMSDRTHERMTRAGLVWTPARFKAAVRALHKRVRANKPYEVDDVLVRAGRRLYGSWRKAVQAAGYDYEELTGRVVWTKARIFHEIRAIARSRRTRATPVPAKLREVAERQFGSWQHAVEAAGFDYDRFTKVRMLMGPKELLTAIRKLARERQAGEHTGPRAPTSFYDSARQHFGSWEAAVSAAKVNYEEFTGKSHWGRKRVIEEIRKLVERRRREPADTPPPLREAAKRHFGSWDRAARAAGYDRLSLIRLRWARSDARETP